MCSKKVLLAAKCYFAQYHFDARLTILKYLFAGIFLSIISAQIPLKSQIRSFDFEGISRRYEVITPQDYHENMPLMLVLHGWSGDIHIVKRYNAVHLHADTAGYVVVYPEGTDNSWNIGLEYCPIRGVMPKVNDVGFLSALIDTVCANYTIDEERVYCIGWSTGGQMALRLAAQLGHRIAAAGSVGGAMNNSATKWKPVKAMPVMEIHGTLDYYNQYYGPNTYNIHFQSAEEEWSVRQTLEYWAEVNQCGQDIDTIDLPDIIPEDSCTVQKIIYGPGTDGAEVVHLKIIDGGHSWPGSPTPYPHWSLEGNRNLDINANVEFWNFNKNKRNTLTNLAHINVFEVFPYSATMYNGIVSMNGIIKNQDLHPAIAFAVISGVDTDFIDTIPLMEDGVFMDTVANKSSWSSKLSSADLPEGSFKVTAFNFDSVLNIQSDYFMERGLINLGPVVLDSISADTVFYPGDSKAVRFYLKNTGSEAATPNLSTKFESLEEFVFVAPHSLYYRDIQAGETAASSSTIIIRVSDDAPAPSSAKIAVSIFSDDQLSWIDTLVIEIDSISTPTNNRAFQSGDHSSQLFKLYPNPAYDKLHYELHADYDGATLIIFDITGQAILQKQIYAPKGSHRGTIDITSMKSGLYFVEIKSEGHSEILKLLVR